jgi:hypothetical protein
MVCFQECLDKLVLVRGSLSKFKFARAVVQARTELLEGPVDSEFFEVSIDTLGPRQKVFSPVHTSRPKMSLQLLKRACPHFLGSSTVTLL